MLFASAYIYMNIVGQRMTPIHTLLQGITSDMILYKGIISLTVELGKAPQLRLRFVDFLVVNFPSPYNVIIS